MGFKPKKKVKKLADGGQTGNPFLGVGIQYQNIAPDVPSLDAAKIAFESYTKNQNYLEEERQKRRPSREAMINRINEYKGTEGGKAAFADMINQQLNEYDRNIAKNDINWLFSAEGTNQFQNLVSASLDPSRVQQLENNFQILSSGYDSLIKNNTLENAQVSNGQVLVRDKETGESRQIALEEFNSNLHDTITGKQRYNELFKSRNYDAAKDSFYTGVQNYDYAIDNLLSAFKDAGGSQAVDYGSQQTVGDIQSQVKNKMALDAAKAQATKNLSNESRSALQAEYLRRINGTSRYTQEGFDAYVDGILNLQVEKMKRSETSYKKYDLKDGEGGDEGTSSMDFNGVVREDRYLSFTDTEGLDSNAQIKIVGSSYVQRPKETLSEVHITGDVYLVGGEDSSYDDTNYSAEHGGQPMKGADFRVKEVDDMGDFLFPVTTGPVYRADGSPKRGDWIDENAIVMEGDSDAVLYGGRKLRKGMPMREIQIPVTNSKNEVVYTRSANVLELENGDLMEVQASPFRVYSKMDNSNWRPFGGREAKILRPLDQQEAIVSFNADISRHRPTIQYFTGPNGSFPMNPSSSGMKALSAIKVGNPQLYNYTVGLINQYNTGTPDEKAAARQLANQAINDAVREVTMGALRSTVSTAKPTYTKSENRAARE